MLRRGRADRYFALLAGIMTASCGGAPPVRAVLARAEPLPVSENQQGHRDEVEGPAEDDAPLLPLDQPSMGGVYLWCQTPSGHACRVASAALGTGPKDPSGLPASLMTVEDLTDDCAEPTIRAVGARLAAAFSVSPTAWRDQGGSYLDLTSLSAMYSAAGCINDAEPARPIAKISAAAGVTPRAYLVRVWDSQAQTPY